jgi:predicted dienelactone hydrolase
MKPILLLPALAAFAAASVPHADAADRIGVRHIAVPAPERGAPIDVAVWYPAASGGTPVLIGDNAVFEGVGAYQDAPILEGRFPIVLLSHGGLRAAPELDGWIASRLAAQGFVVAAPRPPRPTGLDAEAAPREIWLRPADLSATLSALEHDPALADKLDAGRVGALGFLLGGSSALALAGARVDAQAYARSCDPGGTGLDCAWFAKSGVDLHKTDARQMEGSRLDPRVKIVVAVDPELAAAFSAASLSAIAIPVHVISLGGPATIPPGLNAAGLEKRIPDARYDVMADATPFDSFSACKPEGAAILRRDGDDDSLCGDGAGPRAAIHVALAAMIAAAFKHQLQPGI